MAGLLTGRSLYRGSTKKVEHFYSYDNKTGNLTWRSLNEDEEYYTYDALDRLTETRDDLDNIMLQQAYATSGNITLKTGIGNYTYSLMTHPHAFQRGYTGHEMLPEFGLINMNGRMYDPLLGRFLSPDNYVQMPDFSQNFNRYSYCLNNPLKYVDPDGEYGLIDDLSMSYDGNRLKSVSDAAAAVLTNGSADFKDGSASATEYSYNATGALTEDKNKGISAIEYDNFCCPRRITFTDGNATEYIYTQSGQKLAAIHRPHLISVWGDGAVKGDETDPQGANTLGFWDEGEDGLPVDTTEYLGCFVLRNGQVERILFNGGYVTLAAAGNGQVPAFHYYTFDHLGNVRAVYDEAGEIEQLITYDPFGAVIPDLSQNTGLQPYKYNGKELDRTFGLDWYDYGARNYDAAICRWDRVDPLCEKKPGISPYLYCLGNPIRYLDPNGMDEWEIDEDGRIVRHNNKRNHDAFYMVDREGQRLDGKSIEFKYGTVRHQTRSITKNKSYDVFKVKGDKNGTALFEFMADNTKVEWSQLKTGHEGTGTNFLTSSHELSIESGGSNLISYQLKNGYVLRESNHSHPQNTPQPSGLNYRDKDIGYAKWVSETFGYAVSFNVYVPVEKRYVPYNQYSKEIDFVEYYNTLDGLIIKNQ